MATIAKKEVIAAINDINSLITFEKPIANDEKMTVAQLKGEIEAKQKTDNEAFLEGDFNPGQEDSLKIQTVKDLIRLKVTIPATWKGLIDDAEIDEVEDFVAKDPAKAPSKAKKAFVGKTLPAKAPEVEAVTTTELPLVPEELMPKKAKATVIPKATNERTARIIELIEAGIDKKEFVEIICDEFGTRAATLSTMISDFKNEKYNRLPKLVIETEGVLSF